jgi:hypothetical protein
VATHAYAVKAASCVAGGTRTTAREMAYIDALQVYANVSEPIAPADRLQRYAAALKHRVYTPYAFTDENAAIIYGLARLGVGYYSESEPADGWPNLLEAGSVEESVGPRTYDQTSPPLIPACAHHPWSYHVLLIIFDPVDHLW